ncbi:MAG: CinA family protein [Paracoccaceae bacterium]
MVGSELERAAEALLEAARTTGAMVATAESCTGGLVAAAITAVPGSSAVFDRAFVTYSNAAKTEMLGVPDTLLATHGAVSEDVAAAMAEGALARSRATLAVSITGVAGPGGGSAAKPVGLVCFALAMKGKVTAGQKRFDPLLGRHGIRTFSAMHALGLLSEACR